MTGVSFTLIYNLQFTDNQGMNLSLTNMQKQDGIRLNSLDTNENASAPIAGITYQSTDPSVANFQITSSDSLTISVSGLKPGTATIKATVNPGNGAPSYTSDEVVVTVTQDVRQPGPSTHFSVTIPPTPGPVDR